VCCTSLSRSSLETSLRIAAKHAGTSMLAQLVTLLYCLALMPSGSMSNTSIGQRIGSANYCSRQLSNSGCCPNEHPTRPL
jgi:hypothetical protein